MTRLGGFSKYFASNYLLKVAQTYGGDLFMLFENITFQVKTDVDTFWATIGKLCATFYFNI